MSLLKISTSVPCKTVSKSSLNWRQIRSISVSWWTKWKSYPRAKISKSS